MEVNILEEDLDTLNNELDYLKTLRVRYFENIKFLKADKVITSLGEYRRVTSELLIINDKILKTSNIINQLDIKMDNKLRALDFYNKRYEMEVEYLSRKSYHLIKKLFHLKGFEMNKEKIKEKIETEEDFIYCPRLGNSLDKFMDKNPEGVGDDRIAKVLMIEEEEVETIFQSAIEKIRKGLKLK